MTTSTERDAAFTRFDVERIVHRALVDEHGPGALSKRPLGGYLTSEVDRPADYLAGVTVARRLALVAENVARNYAKLARGEGRSWLAVSEVVGDLVDPLTDPADPAAAAFEWVAGPRPSPYDRLTTYWECTSCGQRVTDRGPYNGHPDDDEEGHADGCERHAADVQAWRVRAGWDDED